MPAQENRRTSVALIVAAPDDPRIESVARALIDRGCRIERCSDGLAALAGAREIRPDVVLAQILLPGLDGLALCRALKADPGLREIIVILVSALTAGDRAREAGADAFVGEPMTDVAILGALDEALAASAGAPLHR